MCVMVVSSTGKLPSILEKLGKMDISHLYFYNSETPGGLGVPLISLVPFTNLVVLEDSVLDSSDFRKGMLICEAGRLNVPILSEASLGDVLDW